MKTVLVTGGNGLLGQKVVNLLARREAVKVVSTSTGSNRNPDRDGCTYLPADITNFHQFQELFARVQPTDVVNTAAMTNVDACEQDPETCRNVNVKAVRSLCGLCLEHGARLLHLSTDFIFDGAAGPYREDDEPNPLSVYGQAKLEAEQVIKSSGVKASVLRTILLYGVAPGMSRTNIVLWIRRMLTEGKPINIVQDQFRTPTLAEDLADAVVAAMMREKTGIYHISGAELMSILELAYRVADFWRLDRNLITPVETAGLTQPAPRPLRTGFVILKAQTELGYKPHPLEWGFELMDKQLEAYKPYL